MRKKPSGDPLLCLDHGPSRSLKAIRQRIAKFRSGGKGNFFYLPLPTKAVILSALRCLEIDSSGLTAFKIIASKFAADCAAI